MDMPDDAAGALAACLVGIGVERAVAQAAAALGQVQVDAPGTLIEARGRRCEAVWFLAEGVVAHRVALDDGTTAVVSLYGTGTLFNQQQALFDAPSAVDMVAMTPVSLVRIGLAAYRGLIEREPGFLRAMLRVTAFRATRLAEALAAFKHGSPAFRVGFVLSHFAQAFDPDCGFTRREPQRADALTLPTSAATLASMANMSRTTLGEVLNELGEAGFIGRGYRGIFFNDRRRAWLGLHQRLQREPALPASASCAQLIDALRRGELGPG